MFGQEGGGVVTKQSYVYEPVFCKMWKVIVFVLALVFFLQIVVDVQNTIK